jgi:uncharacterized surface protein with fasciclin (FAS1) repeats
MTKLIWGLGIATLLLAGCGQQQTQASETPSTGATPSRPQNNLPPLDDNNIVSLASHSPNHTKLVAALQAADYVGSVANPGPLTVFAPTDAAFDALPAGTVENLLKPENVTDLQHILQHHVVPAVYMPDALHDGQVLGMVDGTNVTVHISDGHIKIGDANVVQSIRASNGALHIIDAVLLPGH